MTCEQPTPPDKTNKLEVITSVVPEVVVEYGDQFPQHPRYKKVNEESVNAVVTGIRNRVKEAVGKATNRGESG